MYVSINGKTTGRDDAFIPAVTDGLFYGAGCFETLKSYRGSFLHFDHHINRLNDGIKYLTGNADHCYSAETIRNDIIHLLKKNNQADNDAIVRIQVFLSDRLGYVANDKSSLQTVITTNKLKSSADSLSLNTSDITVVPVSCKPAHLKLSNMLHYRQAAINAKNKGADDALMLTVNGMVAETSVANLFWKSGDIVYTPSEACDILPGIMRAITIKLIQGMGIKVKVGEYDLTEIKNSQHVWITNSVREVFRVSKIDNVNFNINSEFYSRLARKLEQYKNEHLT